MEQIEIKVKDYVKIEERPILKDTLVMSPKTQEWCRRKYEGHAKGCINYGKLRCPPNVPLRMDIKDRYNSFTLVFAKFNFKAYKEKRREKYPTWTEKQLGNSRHWQSSIKKMLSDYITKENLSFKELFGTGSGIKVNGKWYQSGESAGVNFFATMRRKKIKLEKNPKNYIYLIVLLVSKMRQTTINELFIR